MFENKFLIFDNDWTLSVFKNWNFSNTIWKDLMNSISEYVGFILNISEEEVQEYLKDFKNKWIQYSLWFEELWIDRNKYFYNTWKNLKPEDYIIDRWCVELRSLIKSNKNEKIMITWAAKIWFERTMAFLWYDVKDFDEIYTWEDFYSKKDKFLEIIRSKSIQIRDVVSIWDEESDYLYIEELWWKWININTLI